VALVLSGPRLGSKRASSASSSIYLDVEVQLRPSRTLHHKLSSVLGSQPLDIGLPERCAFLHRA